ncbi:GspE/PulE/PilB domain-containing protein [Vibrio taketomensis]
MLVEEGIITEQQVEQALIEQKATGRKLGATLIDLGFLSEKEMLTFLSQQLDVPLDLSRMNIDVAVQLLPEVHARRLRALVIGRNQDTLRVAMSDPADLLRKKH